MPEANGPSLVVVAAFVAQAEAKPGEASDRLASDVAGITTVDVPRPQKLAIDLIDAHPRNPRLGFHEPTVAAQVAQMQTRGAFDVAHAITVRPKSTGRYETIYGHQRVESSRRAGLAWVWAYVEHMSDEDAFLALATGNVQEPLTLLEIALHSLDVVELAQGTKDAGLAEHARRLGIAPPNLTRYRRAATVFRAVQGEFATSDNFITGCRDKAEHLAIVSRTAEVHWTDLVRWVVQRDATMQATREHVRPYMTLGEDEVDGGADADRDAGDDGDDQNAADTFSRAAVGPESALASSGDARDQPSPQPSQQHAALADPPRESELAADDGRPEQVEAAFRARWNSVIHLRRLFGHVNADVVQRAIRSWDARHSRDYVLPEQTIAHLVEQERLARRLADIERECDELRTAALRGRRPVVDRARDAAKDRRESGYDLRQAHVDAVERRLAQARAIVADARTPIDVVVDFAARGAT